MSGAAIEAVVPATSANLGCAFDCAALAVNKFLRARAVRAESGIEVRYSGPHPERVPLGRANLLLRALETAAARWSASLPALRVEVRNEIPVGVGLGSSAAAIVAGLLLARELCAPEVGDDELLALACQLEGHPDNVTAAMHGGLTLACDDRDARGVLWAKAVVPSHVKIVAVVPQVAVPTRESRGALPAQYSRADFIHNLQRACLLAAAVFSGAFQLQPEFFRDRAHQPYRAGAAPGIAAALEARHPDLLGVFLSGSGSTVLALARGSEREIAALLEGCFRKANQSASALLLRAENSGARIERGIAAPVSGDAAEAAIGAAP